MYTISSIIASSLVWATLSVTTAPCAYNTQSGARARARILQLYTPQRSVHR